MIDVGWIEKAKEMGHAVSRGVKFLLTPMGVLVLVLAGCLFQGKQAAPSPPGLPAQGDRTPKSGVAPVLKVEPGQSRASALGITEQDIIPVLDKDAILAILKPTFVAAAEGETDMLGYEQVIGVSINGDNRAYPLVMLSRHEIVNDVVGGKPIAVTF